MLGKIGRIYTLGIEIVSCLLLLLSIAAATYGILSRVVPGLPTIIWTEELSRFAIIAMVYVVSGLVFRYEKDLGMELLIEKIPIKYRLWIITVCNCAVVAYLVIAVWIIYNYLPIIAFQTSPALKMPMSILYAVVAAGHVFLMIDVIISTVKKWKKG